MIPLLKASIPYILLMGLLALSVFSGGDNSYTVEKIPPTEVMDSTLFKKEAPANSSEGERADAELRHDRQQENI